MQLCQLRASAKCLVQTVKHTQLLLSSVLEELAIATVNLESRNFRSIATDSYGTVLFQYTIPGRSTSNDALKVSQPFKTSRHHSFALPAPRSSLVR